MRLTDRLRRLFGRKPSTWRFENVPPEFDRCGYCVSCGTFTDLNDRSLCQDCWAEIGELL